MCYHYANSLTVTWCDTGIYRAPLADAACGQGSHVCQAEWSSAAGEWLPRAGQCAGVELAITTHKSDRKQRAKAVSYSLTAANGASARVQRVFIEADASYYEVSTVLAYHSYSAQCVAIDMLMLASSMHNCASVKSTSLQNVRAHGRILAQSAALLSHTLLYNR
jgi:hypothetical protein